MEITKELFDLIAPGEIFRVVITRFQNVDQPLKQMMKFVCLKDKSGYDWVIYAGPPKGHDEDVARYGDKVNDEENIRSLCPCDDEVFALYRK